MKDVQIQIIGKKVKKKNQIHLRNNHKYNNNNKSTKNNNQKIYL